MPSVTYAQELDMEIEYVDIHDLTIETIQRRELRRERPGFWRTLTRGMKHLSDPYTAGAEWHLRAV